MRISRLVSLLTASVLANGALVHAAWANAADVGEAAAPALTGASSSASATDAGVAGARIPDEEVPDDRVEPRSGEIVVVATRIKGQVDAPQAPIITLNEEDIAAYGAASITDLLDALAPQTGSGRGRATGRPVILLNGQRISGFREMRNIPPEAIRRLEILPEEVALRFGYPADQRVINFILKDNFSARTIEAEYSQPDRGGSSTSQVEASLFRTRGQGRLNLTVSADDTTPLFENERGVGQAAGSLPGSAAARSLIADSRDLGVNATWTTGLGEEGLAGSLTLNGAFTRADTTSYAGVNAVTFDPLARRGRTETSEAGMTYARPLGAWQFTATFDGSHAVGTTLIDRNDGAAIVDTAHSSNDGLTALVTVTGRPLALPAGDLALTVKSGFAWTGITSSATGNQVGTVQAATSSQLRRGDASVGFNLGVPIASRRNDVLAGLGDLTLNLAAGVDRLSDFGSLTDWSAGLTWGVTEKLGLQFSYLVDEAAPALTDLGNPLVRNDNVPVYDFLRSETALVTVTTGGNPSLQRETRRDIKLGANWQLPFLKNSNLLVEYFRNSSDNFTAAFPLLTTAIEAAFPGRVIRDANGQLVALDRRPVTFANETSTRLRYGFNIGGTIGKPKPGAGADRMAGLAGGPPPGGGFGRPGGAGIGSGGMGAGGMGAGPPPGGGFGGPPGGGRMGNGQGRWNLSIYHSVQFSDRVTIAANGAVLDLLGGDALTGAGVARHKLEFEGGTFYRGLGLRMNGSWSAPTRVRGSGAPGSSDLRFGSVTKINLRLFADLGQQKRLTDASPFFKGARLSLKIDNLLDSRQRVTDQAGSVPISYQPDLLDPLGRVIGLEFRKQF